MEIIETSDWPREILADRILKLYWLLDNPGEIMGTSVSILDLASTMFSEYKHSTCYHDKNVIKSV